MEDIYMQVLGASPEDIAARFGIPVGRVEAVVDDLLALSATQPITDMDVLRLIVRALRPDRP